MAKKVHKKNEHRKESGFATLLKNDCLISRTWESLRTDVKSPALWRRALIVSSRLIGYAMVFEIISGVWSLVHCDRNYFTNSGVLSGSILCVALVGNAIIITIERLRNVSTNIALIVFSVACLVIGGGWGITSGIVGIIAEVKGAGNWSIGGLSNERPFMSAYFNLERMKLCNDEKKTTGLPMFYVWNRAVFITINLVLILAVLVSAIGHIFLIKVAVTRLRWIKSQGLKSTMSASIVGPLSLCASSISELPKGSPSVESSPGGPPFSIGGSTPELNVSGELYSETMHDASIVSAIKSPPDERDKPDKPMQPSPPPSPESSVGSKGLDKGLVATRSSEANVKPLFLRKVESKESKRMAAGCSYYEFLPQMSKRRIYSVEVLSAGYHDSSNSVTANDPSYVDDFHVEKTGECSSATLSSKADHKDRTCDSEFHSAVDHPDCHIATPDWNPRT